jgi:hypothetical protein
MVERSPDNYQIQLIKFVNTDQGYTEYLIKVMAPGGFSFHFKDRYSSMRNFQSIIKKSFPVNVFNQLPKFPPKKAFGAKSEEFLQQRSVQLQQFFNSFFQSKAIMEKQEHIVLEYLMQHAADEQSRLKIEEYVRYRENRQQSAA